MSEAPVVGDILATFREKGDALYLGEPVSLTEHMLQTALAAERDGAGRRLVAAAVLHDYGHMIHDLPEDCAEQGLDSRHEELGAEHLARWFVPAVTEPIRLHVASKRFLCAVEPEYLDALSPASRLSLELQGGPFTSAEVRRFAASPHATAAVRLRRYDDVAKEPGATTPPLEHYRAFLLSGLRPGVR